MELPEPPPHFIWIPHCLASMCALQLVGSSFALKNQRGILRSFLTHGYSVGAASWDFLICIKFCETVESSSLPWAVGLYTKFVDPQCLPVYGNLFYFSFTV